MRTFGLMFWLNLLKINYSDTISLRKRGFIDDTIDVNTVTISRALSNTGTELTDEC